MKTLTRAKIKIFSFIILFIFLIFTLQGCWDRTEPKSLALITSIIYDLDDEEGYRVIIEIRNPLAGSGGSPTGGGQNANPTLTVTGKGKSVSEALRRISGNLERTLFGGQNKARFFTERFAKKGMYGVTDFLSRDFIADEKSFIVMIKNEDPRIIYAVKTGLSDLVGDYIENLKDNHGKIFGQAVFVPSLKFIQDLLDDGKQPVAGVVAAIPCEDNPAQNITGGELGGNYSDGETQKTMQLEYKGLAAFKEGKFVGYLNGEEAMVYNMLTNQLNAFYMVLDVEDSAVTVRNDNIKCKIKAKPAGDNFEFEINFDVKLAVTEVDGTIDIMKNEEEIKVQEKFSEDIKTKIENMLNKIQKEINSDIIGFGSIIHRQHPKEWKNIKSKWNDMFSEAKMKIKVVSTIKLSGEYKKSIEREAI